MSLQGFSERYSLSEKCLWAHFPVIQHQTSRHQGCSRSPVHLSEYPDSEWDLCPADHFCNWWQTQPWELSLHQRCFQNRIPHVALLKMLMMRARQKMMMKMATRTKKEMRSIVGCRMLNIVARWQNCIPVLLDLLKRQELRWGENKYLIGCAHLVVDCLADLHVLCPAHLLSDGVALLLGHDAALPLLQHLALLLLPHPAVLLHHCVTLLLSHIPTLLLTKEGVTSCKPNLAFYSVLQLLIVTVSINPVCLNVKIS